MFLRAEPTVFLTNSWITSEPFRSCRIEARRGRALLEGIAFISPTFRPTPNTPFIEAQRLGGFRTLLGVPMLREGVADRRDCSYRVSEVRPFTDKQIELATTFADQAAIAIENVRLFDEVQAKTRDLIRGADLSDRKRATSSR